MRKQLCDALMLRAPNPNTVCLTGDLGFMALEPLQNAMGPRFINAGVAEQNMVSVAAGLARHQFEVWLYSIAPFCYAHPFEQIRNDVAFHHLPVKLIGNGGGYAYGVMGPTHHAIEDYGVLLCLPNMRGFVPAFDEDVGESIARAATLETPSYTRLGRGEPPPGYTVPTYAPWRQLAHGSGGVLIVVGPLTMFEACRERRLLLVGVAYAIAACALVFKAQFFVAAAYLLLVFPAFFMVGISTNARRLHFYGMTAIFVLTVYVSQFASSVPVLRLDGSGISGYGFSLLSAQREGIFSSAVAYVFEVATGGTFVLATAAVLLFGTFGVWIIVYPLLFNRVRTRFSLMAALFPVLIVLNYLVMSQGLALDSRAIGRPEELLHRPFVWAYFIVVIWSAAAVYAMLLPEESAGSESAWGAQQDRFAPALVAFVATLALAVPAFLGRGIHSLASWYPDIRGVAIPSCVVKSANYIRTNSKALDVVQASDNDPHFVVSALTERQLFVAAVGGVRTPAGVYRRLSQVNYRLNRMTGSDEVAAFFNQNGIAWYLRRADATLTWSEVTDKFVVFRCESVRVYHFPPS